MCLNRLQRSSPAGHPDRQSHAPGVTRVSISEARSSRHAVNTPAQSTLCLIRDSAASDAPVYDLKRKKGDGFQSVALLCPCFGFVTQAEPARSSCARSLRGMPRVVAPSRECPR